MAKFKHAQEVARKKKAAAQAKELLQQISDCTALVVPGPKPLLRLQHTAQITTLESSFLSLNPGHSA